MWEKIICCAELDGAWCCNSCGRAFNRSEKAWHNTNVPNFYVCNDCKREYDEDAPKIFSWMGKEKKIRLMETTEYIKRADVLERNDLTWYDLDTIIVPTDAVRDKNEEMIYSIPTADVVEVRYGKWIDVYNGYNGVVSQTCSICKIRHDTTKQSSMPNFCPNCGADMRRFL